MTAFFLAVVLAYPIPPQTVWSLSREADLIVLARVDAIRTLNLSDQDTVRLPSHLAVLAVAEVWKGTVPERIEVGFDRNVICPAPAVYLAGQRVVAFLGRHGEAWYTLGLSYGTRYPMGAKGEQAMAAAVQLALAAPADDEITRQRWALKVFADRVTRWDALYTLNHKTDVHHAYYDRDKGESPRLSREALATLSAAFVKAPSYDATLVQVLKLLGPRLEPQVLRAAVDAFETIMVKRQAPWWAPEVMETLDGQLGRGSGSADEKPDAGAPRGSIEREFFNVARAMAPRDDGQQQRAWDELKRRHQLRPTVRSDYEPPHPSATGGHTSL